MNEIIGFDKELVYIGAVGTYELYECGVLDLIYMLGIVEK